MNLFQFFQVSFIIVLQIFVKRSYQRFYFPQLGLVQFADHFIAADGGCLPFADASFDLVLCNSVLHHVKHPLRLFAEIARVASPGGAILLRDLRRPSRPARAQTRRS